MTQRPKPRPAATKPASEVSSTEFTASGMYVRDHVIAGALTAPTGRTTENRITARKICPRTTLAGGTLMEPYSLMGRLALFESISIAGRESLIWKAEHQLYQFFLKHDLSILAQPMS